MIDVHLDDIRVALRLTVIEMLGQVAFREDLPGMQHEIAQQTKLRTGQFYRLAITADALAAFIQQQTGRLQLRLVGQAMRAAQ
ncbi:hypothetical protein D3C72_1818970 [compost metagenome]